jgi:hypothetical protein
MVTGLHLKEVAAAYELYAPEGAVLSAYHASDVIELVKEIGVDHRYFIDDQHLGSLPPIATMVARVNRSYRQPVDEGVGTYLSALPRASSTL